ncbi:hypothetical protein SynWH8101_1278 [Synechococcus sp. WH 8101]|uniref:hypothetical protein n=1 Tax=Synechococcus sp. WH 8101 TaxID=59932 RepID=UPI0010230657|nr:hypothetical protein [Synechococcus sp. WH 8101]QBE68864.1 hypothetical protein SynWH8101_1278 [Synechococcus sp. WH 8101]QNI45092.1 hypothetical protein SynRCC2555_01309 [Synechococcus sp. WH 8101]
MTSTRSPQAARQASTSLPADADWLTDCPDIATAALLISTDDAGIERLQRTQAWGALNVNPEHRTIDQLLFLNRERGEISHVALLNAATPFRRAHRRSGTNNSTGTAAGTVEPVIALVDELLDPLPCDAALLQVQETLLGIASPAETTPLLIADVDALYADATAWGDAGQGAEQVTAAIVDQLILHQRTGSNSSSNAAA